MFRLPTLLIISSFTVMAGATIAPAIPSIQAHFTGVPGADLMSRMLLSVPALFTAIGAPLAGQSADRWGRRPVLIVALVVYAASGLSGLLFDTLRGLLVGRAFLGLSVGGIMTVTATLAADYHQGLDRQRVMAFQGSAMAFGGVIFLLAGGMLADVHWRGPFFIYAAALVALPAALAFLPEPARSVRAPAGSRREPGVPSADVTVLYVLAFLFMAVFFMVPAQGPYLLQTIGVDSNFQIGAAIAASTLSGGFVALLFGRLRRAVPFSTLLAIISVAIGGAYVALSRASTYHHAVGAMLLNGLGIGLMMPALTVRAAAMAPPDHRARILGGLTTAFFVGQFCSPIITHLLLKGMALPEVFALNGAAMLMLAAMMITQGTRNRRAAGKSP